MKGSYRIIIQNSKVRYDFEIRRNITIIKGNSATGKTTLIELIWEYYENGEESGIQFSCERECAVLAGRDWEATLATKSKCILFIDEGNRFVHSTEFAKAIQNTDNYYVIVTREGLVNLPYSTEEIYGIRESGKYASLKQVYNELYHLYGTETVTERVVPSKIIVEDSNSGLEFFKGLSEEKTIPWYQRMESFEWLILKSGIIDVKEIRIVLEKPVDYIECMDYFSWERFFTAFLIKMTEQSYLQYTKRKLNPVYLQEQEKEKICRQLENIEL